MAFLHSKKNKNHTTNTSKIIIDAKVFMDIVTANNVDLDVRAWILRVTSINLRVCFKLCADFDFPYLSENARIGSKFGTPTCCKPFWEQIKSFKRS